MTGPSAMERKASSQAKALRTMNGTLSIPWQLLCTSICIVGLGCLCSQAQLAGAGARSDASPPTDARTFATTGVVKEVKPADLQVVIAHDAIKNYMDAMTMPFKVRRLAELSALRPGDHVSFQLRVTDTESWIEQIVRTQAVAGQPTEQQTAGPQTVKLLSNIDNPRTEPAGPALDASAAAAKRPRHPLMDFPFTNELGQRMTLGQFRGEALAITFFFTRCPIPDFCPRLSRNFQEASSKLASMANGPTNWHFLSVSFDTEFDSPAVLRAYGEHYHYDPKHWSFLTGPADKIRELANLSDVTFEKDNGFYNHNFRTLVIDAAGHLQMTFPVGGDLSDALTTEILKAAAVTNAPR